MSRLAQVLEERAAEVLQRWLHRVREPLAPPGESLPRARNELPAFLRRLIATLRGEASADPSSPEAGGSVVGRAPGPHPFGPGVSLSEVVREYGLLRDVLLDLAEEVQPPVSLGEVRRLTDVVATAIAEVVEERDAQEARRAALFERLPAGVALVMGREHLVVLANEAGRGLLGTNAVLGLPLRALLPAAGPLYTLLARVHDTGQTQRLAEVELRERFFELVAQPLLDAGGQVEGVWLQAQEVTGHVQARRTAERLQAEVERARLRTLIERADHARTAVLDALAHQTLVGMAYLRGPEHIYEITNTVHGDMLDRDVLGRGVREIFPDMDQGFFTVLDQVFQTGQPFVAHQAPFQLVAGRTRGPRQVLCDITCHPVRAPDGSVEGILALVVDVTEQTWLRARAEGERARLNALFQQAPVAIGVLQGPDITLEVVNPVLCRLWGRTHEQMVGKSLLEALPELRGRGFDDLMREVMATGEPFVATEVELQLARGPGGALETGYFNFTYEALSDPRGGGTGVLAVAHEVTEMVLARQRTQALLTESRRSEQAGAAVLDALAQQTLVGVAYLKGPEHVFETANPLFLRFAGQPVVGQRARQVFPESEDPGFSTRLTQVFETGEPRMLREVSLPSRPGGEPPPTEGLFDVAYQPVRAPGGGIDGVLFLVFEVTEQVRLRRAAEGLAEEERTRRDFEQHLIGIVSHDLRNPLGAILLGLELLLRREGLDARMQRSLSRLHASTERAVRMVRDLLDFTQARLGGGLKIERSAMDLHTLVRGVVEEFQATHSARALRLEQTGSGDGQWDGDRLAQMLGNLVGNALKYSPPDTPVTVRSGGEAGHVWLEVHNGGAPIASAALPRLFQPLQRAVEGIDRLSRSVGLGLYIVEQIARAHGGDVQVRSSAPEGTTFTVRLPRPP
jgi:PAS domain S-box-containing protein